MKISKKLNPVMKEIYESFSKYVHPDYFDINSLRSLNSSIKSTINKKNTWKNKFSFNNKNKVRNLLNLDNDNNFICYYTEKDIIISLFIKLKLDDSQFDRLMNSTKIDEKTKLSLYGYYKVIKALNNEPDDLLFDKLLCFEFKRVHNELKLVSINASELINFSNWSKSSSVSWTQSFIYDYSNIMDIRLNVENLSDYGVNIGIGSNNQYQSIYSTVINDYQSKNKHFPDILNLINSDYLDDVINLLKIENI